MTVSNATAARGTAAPSQPDTITIDRNARMALLAALNLRLDGSFEGVHASMREHDRVLLCKAQEFFDHLWPVLDGLEYWDESGSETPPLSYTIPASAWLELLVEDYAMQTRSGIEGDEEWMIRVAAVGEDAFKQGGEMYNPHRTDHPNRQRNDFLVEMRVKLEHDRDELVGMKSIIAALAGRD